MALSYRRAELLLGTIPPIPCGAQTTPCCDFSIRPHKCDPLRVSPFFDNATSLFATVHDFLLFVHLIVLPVVRVIWNTKFRFSHDEKSKRQQFINSINYLRSAGFSKAFGISISSIGFNWRAFFCNRRICFSIFRFRRSSRAFTICGSSFFFFLSGSPQTTGVIWNCCCEHLWMVFMALLTHNLNELNQYF